MCIVPTYDISIDPGINTGYCVWADGRVCQFEDLKNPGVWHAQGDTLEERLRFLADRLRFLSGQLGSVRSIAIEEWVTVFESHDKQHASRAIATKRAMIVCATVRGALFEAANQCAQGRVKFVSKGRVSKAQTAQLAQAYGVTTKNKDALDSFQLGVCSGFDKRGNRNG